MTARTFNVLFICTHNSARSQMAEAILNQLGAGRFHAYSAGIRASGQIHPMALQVLQEQRLDTSSMRSKGWEEFARIDAPQMDFIFTVCDQAAGETCPSWPGQPITAHWDFEDPALAIGDEDARRRVFKKTYVEIANRIRTFLSLPIEKLDRRSLQTS